MIRRWLPSPSPSPTPAQPPTSFPPTVFTNDTQLPKLPIYFSPPLIAMVVVAAAAFLLVSYSRLISRKLIPPVIRLHHRFLRWRRRRQLQRNIHHRRHPSSSFDGLDESDTYSPYGLDESAIRAMPLSIYSEKGRVMEEFSSDCAVCLLEFEENDYVRTLPHCCHSFHVECIDAWLRSHATCPLCRAGLDSTSHLPLFSPLMAARIRPSLDEGLLLDSLDPLPESRTTPMNVEIEVESLTGTPHHHHNGSSNMILKRSYSFGFERSFVLQGNRRSFWRRPSPFGSIDKSRVFSFRSYRGTGGGLKSPFFFSSRRRGFASMSESEGRRWSSLGGGGSSVSRSRYYNNHSQYCYYCCSSVGGGGSSSRRTKSFASPIMCGGRTSSRMRCGDPEALLSPERYNVVLVRNGNVG